MLAVRHPALAQPARDITKVNRKIRDGRTTRPTICKKCVIQMYEQKAA